MATYKTYHFQTEEENKPLEEAESKEIMCEDYWDAQTFAERLSFFVGSSVRFSPTGNPNDPKAEVIP